MDKNDLILDGVKITSLKKIYNSKGDIYHALKSTEDTFTEFGEAYFTTIKKNEIKGWKKHSNMIMNLIVPVGLVRFYFYNENKEKGGYFEAGENNYKRLTIEPNIWVAFEGLEKELNLILNISNILHDRNESENRSLDSFPFNKEQNENSNYGR
jgi:dTDP-4-dehydrorhamnose 3,5-epimerase